MKYFFIPSFIFCFFLIGDNVFAQVSAEEIVNQTLMISNKKHGELNPHYLYLTGEQMRNFNIEKYIAENIQDADIQISGSKISYEKIVKIEFDSRNLALQSGCFEFCKSIVSISKISSFGLTVSPMDDLQGVLVEAVYEGSAAELAGIQQGAMITFVADAVIQSGCDLAEIIEDAEVGEVLDIYIEEEGKQKIVPLILGYKIEEVITYKNCCDSESMANDENNKIESELSIFPNPTAGITQLKFRSTEKSDLRISLTDVAGHQMFNSVVKGFGGYYHEVLDLTDFAAGLYFVQIMQGQQVWTQKVVVQNL